MTPAAAGPAAPFTQCMVARSSPPECVCKAGEASAASRRGASTLQCTLLSYCAASEAKLRQVRLLISGTTVEAGQDCRK